MPVDPSVGLVPSDNPYVREGTRGYMNRPSHRLSGGTNLRAMQQFLRKQGYNIAVTGQMDALTEGAMQDWHSGARKRNPGRWNKQHDLFAGSGGAKGGVDAARKRLKGGTGKTNKNTRTTSYSPAELGDPFALDAGDPSTGTMIDPRLATHGGARMLDKGMAEKLAGLIYDPQIRDFQIQQMRQPRNRDQALADIGNWYGQVGGHVNTARERTDDTTADLRASLLAATQGVMSSLGGSANAASGVVGAAGASDAATVDQMGAAQSQYLADLVPLLSSEAAGAKTAERARQTALAQDIANNLTSLRGQRGQQVGANQMEISQYNNQVLDSRLEKLLNVKQYNNTLDQQRFGNRLSLEQSRIAALLSGAQADAYSAGEEEQGFIPWAKLDPAQRNELIRAAVGTSLDETGALMGKPAAAWNRARQYLVGQGYQGVNQAGTATRRQMERMINAFVMQAAQLRQRRIKEREQATS